MSELKNVLLLGGDALLYFTVLAGLFRCRHRLGIGSFFCALGVMHFLETYLASIFYVSLPLGIVTSPGSTVLFTGKLMLLLLVYIREDAVVVRQPIYGLLIGNLLMIGLATVMRNHDLVSLAPGRVADFGFLGQMGALMLWGTAILFIDAILIILLYEKSRAFLEDRIFLRLAVAGAAVLTFDQLAFFAGLHVLTGAGLPVLIGGWLAKMAAVSLYTILVGIYLYWLERPASHARNAPRIADVFDVLTYRERYEDLLARSGRDALTGAFDRGRLESHGRRMIEEAQHLGLPASLLLVDIDHFKSYNDRFGHAAGDAVLKRIAALIMASVRASDCVFRFGGEEFVVVGKALGSEAALALGERIRREIASQSDVVTSRVTVSVGVASAPDDARLYDLLFASADARLYKAKAAGRNCVVGSRAVSSETPVRLAVAG
ncbi:MAG: GGDEF domain-containing protein [Pseudorhodoplanes sp.]|nr:GGDEF domain-containing protein [Pseudorhodoplanes sp.]